MKVGGSLFIAVKTASDKWKIQEKNAGSQRLRVAEPGGEVCTLIETR